MQWSARERVKGSLHWGIPHVSAFFPRILLSKDTVLKGTFFPAKHFQNFVFFFRTKKLLPIIYIIPWSIFQKTGPLKALPLCKGIFRSYCIYITSILITIRGQGSRKLKISVKYSKNSYSTVKVHSALFVGLNLFDYLFISYYSSSILNSC